MVIAGPTATGKTGLALQLAEHAPVEVISADSGQVFRGLDVGTAKPSLAERRRVPHHVIDIIDPGKVFNAHRFARMARTAIIDIETRGAPPIVVGGTGFYIQALLTASPLGAMPPDPELRGRLTRELETQGTDPLIRRLRNLAPNRAVVVYEDQQLPVHEQLAVSPSTSYRNGCMQDSTFSPNTMYVYS